MIGKKLINTGAAGGADAFKPSNHFNTVLYTGNGGTQRIGGYINRGAVFNGSSSSIDIGAVIGNSDTSCSLSAWINIDSGFTSGNRTIFGAASGASGTEGVFRILLFYVSANTYKITIARTVASSGTNFYYSSSWTASSMNTGQWYNISATYNSTGRVAKTYLNGTLVDSFSLTTGASVTAVANSLIGGQRTNTSLWLGKIDQVRIFNKALSSTEVTTLYGETHASTTIETTDIFNDNSGVALYQLDGNANDTGGASGKFGSAAIFNGSNYITTPTLPDYRSGFTFSCWVLADTTLNKYIITQKGTGDYANFQFRLVNAKINVTTGNGTSAYYIQYTHPTALTDGWHHLVVTGTASSISIYADGVFLTTQTGTAFVNSPNMEHIMGVNYYLGSIYDGLAEAFSLDQFRIYDTALSSTDVSNLYNETNVPTTNLVAHYKLDGDARDEQQLYDGTATNVTYAYDGTASNVTYQEATNFSPDLVWVKARSVASSHNFFDSIRGNKRILSNGANAEVDLNPYSPDGLTSFDSNGFTIGDNYNGDYGLNGDPAGTYGSSNGYVAWCFNAGEDTPATNNVGTISSTVKANQEAGFSIVKYTGDGGSATLGHGLSQQVEMVITKSTESTSQWMIYHKDLTGNTSGDNPYNLYFRTDAELDLTSFGAYNSFTNSVFPVTRQSASTAHNNNNIDYIAYCFHSVDGYQKVGSYTGNGSTNGTMVETGFEPAFVMIKATNLDRNWVILDNKRGYGNNLSANTSLAEYLTSNGQGMEVQFLSNGFQIETSSSWINNNTTNYIYLAIAADPDTTTPTVENSFDVVTYTGNGGTQSIDTDFKPDLVWIKSRSNTYSNTLTDSVRGNDKAIITDGTNSEYTDDTFSITDNGFVMSAVGVMARNVNSQTYVAWCWKAGDHDDNLPQINTEGTIDSTVSVNDAAGFSIVKYTGTGVNGNYGHGLSSAPELIITKNIDWSTPDWFVYHKDLGTNGYLRLNQTTAKQTTSTLFSSTPTSTVVNIGNDSGINRSNGDRQIAYCFTSIAGYQKIDSYTGTGGTLSVTTGFAPRFVMIKRTNTSGSWMMYDNQRHSTAVNNVNYYLLANSSGSENTTPPSSYNVTFQSTGFTIPSGGGGDLGASGSTYIYLAIK